VHLWHIASTIWPLDLRGKGRGSDERRTPQFRRGVFLSQTLIHWCSYFGEQNLFKHRFSRRDLISNDQSTDCILQIFLSDSFFSLSGVFDEG
jgi:hypothetical protein